MTIAIDKRGWESQRPEQLKGSGVGKALEQYKKLCKEPSELGSPSDYAKAKKANAALVKALGGARKRLGASKKALGKEARPVEKLIADLTKQAAQYDKGLATEQKEFTKAQGHERELLKGIKEAKSKNCYFAVVFDKADKGEVRIGKKDAEIAAAGRKAKQEEGGRKFAGRVQVKAGKLVFEFDGEKTVPKSMMILLRDILKKAKVSYKPLIVVKQKGAGEDDQQANA